LRASVVYRRNGAVPAGLARHHQFEKREYDMRSILIAAAAIAGAVALPSAAMARPGFVTASLSLRAGPSLDFPAVDRIPAGARVNVHGCIAGYRWCDVSFAGDRGWIDGDELQLLYGGRRVLIVDYGPRIDFPIIGFNVGSYWGHYYRSRSFYGRRDYWQNRYQAHRGGHNVTVGHGGHDRIRNEHHRNRIGTAGRDSNRAGVRTHRGRDATVGAGVREHNGRGNRGMRGHRPETTGAAPHGRSEMRRGPSRGAATTGAGIGGRQGGGAGARGAAAIGGGHGGGHGGGGAAAHGGRGAKGAAPPQDR
jgi:uncharacterized protein YraI